MLGTRYEEHVYFSDQLPFHLATDIERTPFSGTHEANWHETLEIQRCTKGRGFVLLDGVRHEIREGDIIAVNSDVLHFTGSEDDITYSCLIIDAQFCRQADIDPSVLLFEPFIQDEAFAHLLRELETVFYSENDPCRVARLREMILRILITLRTDHFVGSRETTPSARSFASVRETIRFIRDHYNRKLTLNELSRHIFTDKYRLSREFKQATGQTVVHYINCFRCQKAVELIGEGVPIAEAAGKCGFNNMSFFARTCRACTGHLPSHFKGSTAGTKSVK